MVTTVHTVGQLEIHILERIIEMEKRNRKVRWMKRLFIVMVVLLVFMALSPMTYAATAKSGKCGKNVTWTYKDGTLIISGKGSMKTAPWSSYYKKIKKVVIKNGVTSIRTRAFSSCSSLKTVKLAPSVSTIGDWAFFDCTSLKSVKLPPGVGIIGEWAFLGCRSLKSITIPSSVGFIGDIAFGYCDISLTGKKTPGFTVIGEKGSAAEQYAKENSLKFKTQVPAKHSSAKTVATIGNHKYSSLQDAFNAVKNGQTILVSKNIDMKNSNLVAKNDVSYTVNLNKKKIKNCGNFIIKKGNVKIRNGSIIQYSGGILDYRYAEVKKGASLEINGGTYKFQSFLAHGTLTVKGGTIGMTDFYNQKMTKIKGAKLTFASPRVAVGPVQNRGIIRLEETTIKFPWADDWFKDHSDPYIKKKYKNKTIKKKLY